MMDKLCKIRDLQRAVADFEKSFEMRHGIGLHQGLALCSLCEAEKLSSGRLCELLGLSSSNTSKVLASAEKKGLVSRSMGTADKRQMYFSLTESGRALISSIKEQEIVLPTTLQNLMKE